MDFMKVFDQTVREIKREVNLKVFQIPEIEQKVLDATDNEPWGPHGSALAEIAQATEKFSEYQIIMNVLWTRLSETGKDWRYVYKALTVIEYLIANGSVRTVYKIVEHTYQIASLSGFEYVEPSGKDMGINVRKKVETLLAILNNQDKIREARVKAAKTRDKYFGLSSSGITYKSSFGSASSSHRSNSYGGDNYDSFNRTSRGNSFGSSQKEKEQTWEGNCERETSKTRHVVAVDNQVKSSKRGSTRYGSKDQDKAISSVRKSSINSNEFGKHRSHLSDSSILPSSNYDDNLDDFDPRGTSIAKPTAGSSNEVDLFANFVDEPIPVVSETLVTGSVVDDAPDIDLFQDATFLSASHTESITQNENNVKPFAPQPAVALNSASTVDLFDALEPVSSLEPKGSASTTDSTIIDTFAPVPAIKVVPKVLASPANEDPPVDPFASVALNNFDDSDIFCTMDSHSGTSFKGTLEQRSEDVNQSSISGNTPTKSKAVDKKNSFQVKSGIWADSINRGLIDLNISAPKNVNLADVGIVGDVSNGGDKGVLHSFYMGSAMDAGSGLNRSSFSSSSLNTDTDDLFSSLSSGSRQDGQYGMGNIKK